MSKQASFDYVRAARNLRIQVKVINQELLSRLALEDFDRRQLLADKPTAKKRPHRAFRDRIEVNYVRHRLTEYDGFLKRISNLDEREMVEEIIRIRVYKAIAEAYPHLAAECSGQMNLRHPPRPIVPPLVLPSIPEQ